MSDCFSNAPVRSDEVTPHAVYLRRRTLLAQWAAGAAAAALSGQHAGAAPGRALASVPSQLAGAMTVERPTSYEDASGYNNFYEFGSAKSDPARYAARLQTRPWSVQVDGLVHRPGHWAIEDLLALAPQEERVYRLRCVEGWSMVIPWIGYSLATLIRRVEPMTSARYVEFTTLADATQMPGVRASILHWPYTEGLRLDEALHPLTLLAFGMYGELLAPQNGAPLRVVVPWKYGFKSAKSLVRIRLTQTQPATAWNRAQPGEYGFYSNVNPQVDHPRWSQASERRIGEDGLFAKKRKTLLFNGYGAQVAQLYAGMDLQKFF